MVDGLPVGMQLTGRRYADADVPTASAAFERVRPWYDSYARCGERSRLKSLRSIRCRREPIRSLAEPVGPDIITTITPRSGIGKRCVSKR